VRNLNSQLSPAGAVSPTAAIDNDTKRRQIRRYYMQIPKKVPITLMVIGFLFMLLDATRGFGFLMLMAGAAWLGIPLILRSQGPTDGTIDAWLHEDVNSLIPRARERLNLEETQAIRDPLPVVGIVLRSAASIGVPANDMRSRKGTDRLYRFSVRSVTIFHLFEHKVSSYQCYYNCMKGVPLNERDDEYYYRDIVSVSTAEDSTNYTLANGVTMRHWQAFRLSVASGDNISVIVRPLDLKGVDDTAVRTADSGADNAIRALRKVLEEKKLR